MPIIHELYRIEPSVTEAHTSTSNSATEQLKITFGFPLSTTSAYRLSDKIHRLELHKSAFRARRNGARNNRKVKLHSGLDSASSKMAECRTPLPIHTGSAVQILQLTIIGLPQQIGGFTLIFEQQIRAYSSGVDWKCHT